MPLEQQITSLHNDLLHLGVETAIRFKDVKDKVDKFNNEYTEAKKPSVAKEAALLGSKSATATFIGDTVRNSTEAIITATRVFKDKESSPQEQAASVLRVISVFAMLLALGGPELLLVGP